MSDEQRSDDMYDRAAKAEVKPIRAWAMIDSSNNLNLNWIFNTSQGQNDAGKKGYKLIEVTIAPVVEAEPETTDCQHCEAMSHEHHRILVKYDDLWDEAEQIRIERDQLRAKLNGVLKFLEDAYNEGYNIGLCDGQGFGSNCSFKDSDVYHEFKALSTPSPSASHKNSATEDKPKCDHHIEARCIYCEPPEVVPIVKEADKPTEPSDKDLLDWLELTKFECVYFFENHHHVDGEWNVFNRHGDSVASSPFIREAIRSAMSQEAKEGGK